MARSTRNTINNALIAKDAAKAGLEAVVGEKAESSKNTSVCSSFFYEAANNFFKQFYLSPYFLSAARQMYFWHSDKARNGSRLARAKAGLAAAGRAGAKGYVKKKAKKTGITLFMNLISVYITFVPHSTQVWWWWLWWLLWCSLWWWEELATGLPAGADGDSTELLNTN